MTSRITALTAEQAALLPQFRDEWFRVGTSTGRADRARAEQAILALRAEINVTKGPIFIWCESPATCLLALHVLQSPPYAKWAEATRKKIATTADRNRPQVADGYLWSSLRSSLGSSLRSSLGSSLWSSIESSLGSSLRSSLESSLWSSLWSSIGSIWSSLGSSLRSSLGSSLWSSLLWSSPWSSLWSSIESSIESSLGWGQHEAYWISFYVFCRDVLGVKYEDQRSRQLDAWRDIAQSCCWWWCYENYVVVSERPTVVRMEPDGRGTERLHCDDGPALAFADGWQVHTLHGVRVSAEIVTTPAGQLDPNLVLSEQNVEVRREILRKIGVERAIVALGATVVDRQGDYELLRVTFTGAERIYLKMRNPSIGVWHVEPVGPECSTVAGALHWRKPDDMRAIPVSNDGAEWQQQGDVYIWPLGAKALKQYPQVLT